MKKCGTEQRASDKFCRKCGTQVSIQSSDERVQAQVTEKMEIAEEPNQSNYSENNDNTASYNQDSSSKQEKKEEGKRGLRSTSRWMVLAGLGIFLLKNGISVPFWNWLVIGPAFYLSLYL